MPPGVHLGGQGPVQGADAEHHQARAAGHCQDPPDRTLGPHGLTGGHVVEERRHREGDGARPQGVTHTGEHLGGAGALVHGVRGAIELDHGEPGHRPGGQDGADL